MFALSGAQGALIAEGVVDSITDASTSRLDEQVRAWFGGADRADALLVGAIAFDRTVSPILYRPARVVRGDAAMLDRYFAPTRRAPAARAEVFADPSPGDYAKMVGEALGRIDRGLFAKVVLARGLHVDAASIDLPAVAARLAADPTVTAFLLDLPPETPEQRHALVGATPEQLVSRRGERIFSNPLAGSARRSEDAALDRAAGEKLLASDKDRREHGFVVDYIMDMLAPYCSELRAGPGPALQSTATMWHLGTRIEGRLRGGDGPGAAGLAALLHPTPAVGGVPLDAALSAISDIETHDRGFYAGAIGWTDAKGDGDWYVTLRCAEIRGNRLTLHAGAGIVAGSDPADEVAETDAKFRAMLRALDLDGAEMEQGALSWQSR